MTGQECTTLKLHEVYFLGVWRGIMWPWLEAAQQGHEPDLDLGDLNGVDEWVNQGVGEHNEACVGDEIPPGGDRDLVIIVPEYVQPYHYHWNNNHIKICLKKI